MSHIRVRATLTSNKHTYRAESINLRELFAITRPYWGEGDKKEVTGREKASEEIRHGERERESARQRGSTKQW